MATFLEVSKLVTGFSDLGGDIEAAYLEVMSSKSDWIVEFDKLMVAADEALVSADPEANGPFEIWRWPRRPKRLHGIKN